MIVGIGVILIFLLLLQDLLLTILLKLNFKPYQKTNDFDLPKVSILIPCRNEAINLPECLASLSALEYPSQKLQIIFGNDRSTDQTGWIISDWIKNHRNSSLIEIADGDSTQMNGKANALSQMEKYAEGELYLFTDADCRVPSTWITAMVNAQQTTSAGVVTGITKVISGNWFEKMQSIDWWLTLGMVKVMSDLGVSVTSLGNNMLVSKEAYQAVGGFQGIPFSLTEDFEIAKNIVSKGFESIHLVSKENLISTLAQGDLSGLMSQRKRWMYGAMALPFYWRAVLALQVLFFPFAIYLCFFHPFEVLAVWLLKLVLQYVFIFHFAQKARQKLNISFLIVFELYYLFTSWFTIVYYFWPSKIDWKGRKYG